MFHRTRSLKGCNTGAHLNEGLCGRDLSRKITFQLMFKIRMELARAFGKLHEQKEESPETSQLSKDTSALSLSDFFSVDRA